MSSDNKLLSEYLERMPFIEDFIELDSLAKQLSTFSENAVQVSKLDLADMAPVFSVHQKEWENE